MWLKALLVALVVTSYPVAMHLLLTSGHWPATTLLMALLPFAVLPLTLLKAGQLGWSLLSASLLIAISASRWDAMLQNPSWVYLLQNIAMECLMGWGFCRTLLPGHEPLISQFARRIHGTDYSPAVATYTRQVTWAWTLYFVVVGVISSILFVSAPLAVWSWFVNFGAFILLGFMFAGEYVVRRWRLRDMTHISFIKSVTPYWDRPPSARAPVDGPP
jgi:uncharacterized membrane protein